MPSNKIQAIDLAASVPWAIRREALENIFSIARREADIEAVQARLGKPLDNTRTVSVRDGVAIIPVTGPIFRYANLFTAISGATSVAVLATDLRTALDDPSIHSIVLEIDSPGGEASGISEFADQVRAADKKVVAYVSNDGASAAYWIASAAHEMVIAKTAMVGSIGVVAGYSTEKDEKKLEIVSSQSPEKRVDVTTDEGRASVQKTIDALADVFVSAVAEFRGVDRETVLSKFGKGGVLVGGDAVEAGMADRLGSLESVIASLSGGATNGKGAIMAKDDNKPDSSPVLTVEALQEQNPDVYQAVLEQGATNERKRIQGIEAVADGFKGHEKLVAQLKADGSTTKDQAAMAILDAERQNRANSMKSFQDSAPAPVDQPASDVESHPAAKTTSADKYKDLPLDERCEKEWEDSPQLRSEFGGDLDAYKAYSKANESQLVKSWTK